MICSRGDIQRRADGCVYPKLRRCVGRSGSDITLGEEILDFRWKWGYGEDVVRAGSETGEEEDVETATLMSTVGVSRRGRDFNKERGGFFFSRK